MTRFSDAALLKGDFAKMLKEPPVEAEWKKAACDNGPEEAAQVIAKQIFEFQQSLDEKTEKLEVITFSSLGPIKVLGITPMDGEMMRIDGVNPAQNSPVSIIQHVRQLSLTFTKIAVPTDAEKDEAELKEGLKIGYVIFDELTERKKVREAAKRKRVRKKPAAKAKAK